MKSKDFIRFNRRKTNTIKIGEVFLGSEFPVRLQSMTNTDTSDIEATVDQIIKIVDAGADMVRLTVPTSYVAEKLHDIKDLLHKKEVRIPLIADIHFSPKAAETAAQIIDKVRINPGNYVDKKQFKHIEYTEKEYVEELDRINENFVPLLDICKNHNTSIRIGTNHGSLSDRILSRYGDTPLGMVESTMEFLRICKKEDFNDVVISMKASNPIVMIHATRLLSKTMDKEGINFPIHLGVTEAGNDLEGRIKSSVGIGSLLADGIGDTIRVSLTEAPEKEIPVAKSIVKIMHETKLNAFELNLNVDQSFYDPFSYNKRKSIEIQNVGGDKVPIVISDISGNISNQALLQSGLFFNEDTGNFEIKEDTADYLFVGSENLTVDLPVGTRIITDYSKINGVKEFPLFDIKTFKNNSDSISTINFVEIQLNELEDFNFESLKGLENVVIILNLNNVISPVHAGRAFFFKLIENKINLPVLYKMEFNSIGEYEILKSSAEIGSLFIDGFGDGIWIGSNKNEIREARLLAFGILQACRTRISKTEYISCPSCGRTLFNLEETTAKIKAKTSHLTGIKIGIMGCIVNGPGEMADADFGYVGTGSGKITLYKQQDVIKRNIPEENAVEELLKLIEQYS